MLRAFAATSDQPLSQIESSGIDAAVEAGWVWIDLMPESVAEIADLGRQFQLNHLAVEDATADTHFPKVDDFESHVFVVLHGISERDGRLETNELDAFVGRNFLITVHHGVSPSIDWVLENATANATGPDGVLARLAEASSRRLLPLVDSLDETIDELEERSLQGDGGVVPEIQALRRDTVRLRRVIGPQRSVLSELSRTDSDLIGERAMRRFASAHDHHMRVYESLEGARYLLTSVLETYRGTVAEKMNEVMKVLTVYTAILLPLTLVAGIYGMNFDNMPELNRRWGYFAVLGIMAAAAIAQWVYFARRGFIGAFSFRRLPRALGRGLSWLAHVPLTAIASVAGNQEPPPKSEDEASR